VGEIRDYSSNGHPTPTPHSAMKPSSCLPIALLLAYLADAVPHTQPAEIKRQISNLRTGGYDFIIAGGGTSGLTVTDRLSEAFPQSKLPPYLT
jgi:hypothetical protein